MTLDPNVTVGRLVAERPARARVFDRLGIDYCCGGGATLDRACASRGIDVDLALLGLDDCDRRSRTSATDEWIPSSMGELADFIVATHHAYLRRELPRLSALAAKVADAHGAAHPELRELRGVLTALEADLGAHADEEERVVFPRIKRLEDRARRRDPALGTVSDTIGDLEREHADAGEALARLRALAADYVPPADACESYRALLAGLAELDLDLRTHIHRENNILFPAALAAERASAERARP